jgi:tRNA-2-methylthio-N6-dimethylallyladenosine synthase
VRQTAEDRVYGLIPKIKEDNPEVKVILTGCLSGRKDVQRRLKKYVDIWLPITELPLLGEKLDESKKYEAGSLSGYLSINPKYNSGFSAYVPIGNGCDNFCSYCVVPHARGREIYRPMQEIIEEVQGLLKRGYKEIIMIAQNVNSYKSQNGNGEIVGFVDLLKGVNDLPGEFWLRFLTNHPKDMSMELIQAVVDCKKVCHHIHLPVQAGDDEILALMNRKYTVEHYKKLVEQIWQALPDVSLTTDIIVGFPGESEEQFNRSADLCRWAKFDNIFIGQYSPRPYTAASKMTNDVTKVEKKRREEVLTDILRETAKANHQKWMGQVIEVLVESGKHDKHYGHSRDNTVVEIIGGSDELIGQFINIKITEARDFGMTGKVYE